MPPYPKTSRMGQEATDAPHHRRDPRQDRHTTACAPKPSTPDSSRSPGPMPGAPRRPRRQGARELACRSSGASSTAWPPRDPVQGHGGRQRRVRRVCFAAWPDESAARSSSDDRPSSTPLRTPSIAPPPARRSICSSRARRASGKTRFTDEVAQRATERGFRVLRGECVNLGGSQPALRTGRRCPAEPGRGSRRGRDRRAGRSVTGGPRPARPGLRLARDDRARPVRVGPVPTLRGTPRTPGAAGGQQSPTLLVFEDLHWADQATREAISFLVRSLRDVPIVLLGHVSVGRAAPTPPAAAVARRPGSRRPCRAPRTRPVRSSAAQRRCSPPSSGRRRATTSSTDVFDRSDGNPFFAEELLAAGRQDPDGPRLPPTLKEILLAHIATVDDPAATVLGVAAVAGRRVSHDLLARVADLPEASLHDGLRAAIGGNLLVVETDPRHGALRVPPRPRPGGRLRRAAPRRAPQAPSGDRRGARREAVGSAHDRGRALGRAGPSLGSGTRGSAGVRSVAPRG